MNLMSLFKKIFIPSYTDRQVNQIKDQNQKELKDATKSMKKNNKELRDVAVNIYYATGGRHGH